MKGITARQIRDTGITLILNNTYHLSLRPGTEILDLVGGSHQFQDWHGNLLTDSGGFQMVSLAKLSVITEEGVLFENPFKPGETLMLRPEDSMRIQHAIGADIMMQLDDVVASLTEPIRMKEASERSVRWLDRCIAAHHESGKNESQNLFAIVQGGLDPELRDACLDEMLKRSDRIPGYAIGGLSGGEEKSIFWRIVLQCADRLPPEKPRYCMGIGYGEDLLVCAALGVDMADCVFPTRTARFGLALSFDGHINLRLGKYAHDFSVLDPTCPCPTCDLGSERGLSRSYLHQLAGRETVGAHAITLHNVTYQHRLMKGAREAILEDRFPRYLKDYFARFYGDGSQYPKWAVEALRAVGVDLLEDQPDAVPQGKPQWDYVN